MKRWAKYILPICIHSIFWMDSEASTIATVEYLCLIHIGITYPCNVLIIFVIHNNSIKNNPEVFKLWKINKSLLQVSLKVINIEFLDYLKKSVDWFYLKMSLKWENNLFHTKSSPPFGQYHSGCIWTISASQLARNADIQALRVISTGKLKWKMKTRFV